MKTLHGPTFLFSILDFPPNISFLHVNLHAWPNLLFISLSLTFRSAITALYLLVFHPCQNAHIFIFSLYCYVCPGCSELVSAKESNPCMSLPFLALLVSSSNQEHCLAVLQICMLSWDFVLCLMKQYLIEISFLCVY